MKLIKFIILLLLVVGGLNWGLVGFFQYDVVSDIFGGMYSTGARVVYSLIGLAGLCGIKWLIGCCCGGCGCNGKCGCGCSSNRDR